MQDSIKDCIFCKIIRGEIPCYTIYEDSNYIAFLDIAQFTQGHTVVIPKLHYPTFTEVPNPGEYFEKATKIANYFKTSLAFDYVDILIFGRMIAHAHIHLIPHNNDNPEWNKALSAIGELQANSLRRPTAEQMIQIKSKFEYKSNL